MSEITLRRATSDDAPELAANGLRAYPMVTGSLAEFTARLRSGRIPIETLSIAERDGRVVGQARTHAFRGWIGGVETPVAGLGGVAVAPEARRTGVTRVLLVDHIARARAAGATWSFLYPFAPSFYRAKGWGVCAHRVRWRFRPSEIPLFPERTRVVRISLSDDADHAEVQRVYHAHCARTNGSLSRSDTWLKIGGGDRRHAVGVRDADGRLTGYLIYEVKAPTPRPQKMFAEELVALDDASERALLGFIAAQGEQIDNVHLELRVDHPFAAFLNQAMPAAESMDSLTIDAGEVTTGAMARILDLRGALAGRGYPGGSGSVAFQATDELIPSNDEPVTLSVEGGVSRATPGRQDGAPLVSGTIADISSVLIGAIRLADAVRYGLVRIDAADRVAALDSLLALPPPYPILMF